MTAIGDSDVAASTPCAARDARSLPITFMIVITAGLVCSFYASIDARGLYHDGVYYVFKIAARERFFLIDPARNVVQILRQAPIVLLSEFTEMSVFQLGQVFTFILLALPTLLCALFHRRRFRNGCRRTARTSLARPIVDATRDYLHCDSGMCGADNRRSRRDASLACLRGRFAIAAGDRTWPYILGENAAYGQRARGHQLAPYGGRMGHSGHQHRVQPEWQCQVHHRSPCRHELPTG